MKTKLKILCTGFLIAVGAFSTAHAQTYHPQGYPYNYNAPTTYYGNPYQYDYYQHPYYPYPPYGYPSVSLSQNSLALSVGQTATVSVYGGTNFSLSSNNAYSTWQSVSGNTVTIQGLVYGSNTITVCATGGYYQSGCANLYVNVSDGNYYGYQYPYNSSAYYYPYNQYLGNSLLDEETVRIDVGEQEKIDINEFGNWYRDTYVSNNSNRRVTSVSINGDKLKIKGLREGSTVISVCQGILCDSVRVIVRD